MLLRSIRAELMKCRRSPVWLAFVVLPLFPAILGTVNYLGNLEVLESQWYSLWTQHVLFASLFFLPAQLGVFCAWQWRLEHTDHNWNQAMTAPVPARDLYLAKLILAAGLSFLAQAAIGVLFVISGKLAGLSLDVLANELAGTGLGDNAGLNSDLFGMEHFTVSPHIGGSTHEAYDGIGVFIVEKAAEFYGLSK